MYENYRNYGTFEEEYASIKGMNAFISKVFGWMFVGLLVTAGTSYYVLTNERLLTALASNLGLVFGIIIIELVLVSILSARITRLSYGTALGLFLGYAALNGVTFTLILLVYTGSTVVTAFGITAITFGIMCVYGYVTKADLTQFRTILMMGLIGIIVLSLVNIFVGSSGLDWLISILSLVVFLGLTAYDMQKLKSFYFGTEGDLVLRKNLGILGALALYLDFINLFRTMLRIFGRRRQ
ncbi:MAG: Bax inhibitor-1/YccA family protein [Clostridiaceae bacterium]|nr:Bax inhibitor-1/YccA family protein [Clostridiaceae bacterium]